MPFFIRWFCVSYSHDGLLLKQQGAAKEEGVRVTTMEKNNHIIIIIITIIWKDTGYSFSIYATCNYIFV